MMQKINLDLDQLTYEEIILLQKDLERYKQTRSNPKMYKVSFYIGFHEHQQEDTVLRSSEEFSDYFLDAVLTSLEEDLNLPSKHIANFQVTEVEAKGYQKHKMDKSE